MGSPGAADTLAASAPPCCARAHGRSRARRQAATEAAFDLAPLQTDDGLLRIAVVLAELCHYAVRAAAAPAACGSGLLPRCQCEQGQMCGAAAAPGVCCWPSFGVEHFGHCGEAAPALALKATSIRSSSRECTPSYL